ncbi:restriction endonuclease [Alteromonas sp. MB-3u-76]|uniref:restriction endonuclease subunit S n=1 Tax=unclassified Alteromonas TaxID=2614992 RepID=UPI0009041B80|nr:MULTISPECIES: restriction endonuclease subunit S [unclassified Alteromonas]APE06272.1 restriction endonuclease [Alteromonas sp. RW2A1]AUC88065.1 restriction endonuclease [Alteromonas sp. MB-3u-76]
MTIPASWKQTELGEILLSIVGGGTPSKSIQSYYEGNIPWMSVKDMNRNILHDTVDHISEEAVKNSSTNVIPSGTPIVATRMSLGKIIVANFDSAINQDLKALFPASGVNREYLIDWYRSISRKIEELGTGTTVKGIRLDVLKSLEFPLPPPEEQKVIADKLDALLAQVEITKARLERIPEILKTFRQSVLAAAVSGKLTQEWREKPAEWIEMKLNDVADNVVDCPHSTPKWSALGKYCVKTTAFNPFYLDLSEQGFVSEEVFAERIKRLKPEPGDILYSREGTVGIACQIPSDTELCLGQRMVLIRAGSEINSKFLTIVLNSDKILSIVRQMTIGSTVPRVNMKDIRSYPIPVPTQNEQTEIIRRVEELFAFADRIEQRANVALDRVNNLTQSILAKAFRGELTTDWRAANPELISGENSAEALLAKIKAEREALKPAKKSSVRKKS